MNKWLKTVLFDDIVNNVTNYVWEMDLDNNTNLQDISAISIFIDKQAKKLVQTLSLGNSWLGDLALEECFDDLADNINEIREKDEIDLADFSLTAEEILKKKGVDLLEFYFNKETRQAYLAEMSSLLTIDEEKKEGAYRRLLQEHNVQKIVDIPKKDYESLFADNYRELFSCLLEKGIDDREISDLILVKTFLYEQVLMAKAVLKTVFDNINTEDENFKSSNFETIHQANEVADLIILRNQLRRNLVKVEEKMEENFKKDTATILDNELLEDEMINLKKSIFEINRLFYLMKKARKLYKVSPFLDQHQRQVATKIKNIFEVRTKNLKWWKNKEGKHIWTTEKATEEFGLSVRRKPMKVNSGNIQWYITSMAKLKEKENEKRLIDVVHYSFRAKTRISEMIKNILGRKVDDKWWLKIILEEINEDSIHIIRKILQTEFNNKNWHEKIEYLGNGSNDNGSSSDEFKTYKGTLELPVACYCDDSEKIYKEKDRKKDRLLNVLKDSHYYPLEVQITDIESYIKNDLDVDSPSFHGRYKEDQIIRKLFTILFPEDIYADKGVGDYLSYSERSWIVFRHSFEKTAKRKFNGVMKKMKNKTKESENLVNNKEFIAFIMNKIFELAVRDFHSLGF